MCVKWALKQFIAKRTKKKMAQQAPLLALIVGILAQSESKRIN